MDRLQRQPDLTQDAPKAECWERGQKASPEAGWLKQASLTVQDDAADARMAWLLRTIEAEIIPRLMLAHQTAPLPSPSSRRSRPTISHEDVVAFAALALNSEAAVAVAQVEALRARGLPLECVYLELLAPAARHLGALWDADLCDFTQVTLGLWRLQQVMYDQSPAFQVGAASDPRNRRAMLVPVPGSQHTLGLFMVAEFFRRAGWEVWGEPLASTRDLGDAVRAEWFDLVGLSVGSETQVSSLPALILALRKASLNPVVGVMVGGPAFSAHPELAVLVGADATATDAPQAILQAEDLLARRSKRC